MKVAVVTGSRADYGLLRPTIVALSDDDRFELALLVTAMHLEKRHGMTIGEIERDGFAIAARVPVARQVERPGEIARKLGETTTAFTDVLDALRPDILLVLGDRFEVLAASLAATGLSIPIAHLHGGELSEGSLDDAMRHCVTKLAHLHFVATNEYAERVCQLGEEPWRVNVVGAAAIESIKALELLDRKMLASALQVDRFDSPLISLTLHAASLRPEQADGAAQAVASALDDVLDSRGTVILTLPNDDPGSTVVRDRLLEWADAHTRVHAFESLGQLRYLSLLSHADAVVGNSSSALIETPSFRVPVVNVGDRQLGRIHPANVLSVPADRDSISRALRSVLEPGFRNSLASMDNPFGDGKVSSRVLAVLAAAPPAEELRRKRFVDLPDGAWRSSLELGGAR